MRHLPLRLVCLLLGTFASIASAAPRVSAQEESLVASVQAGEQRSIALLEQIVNVNSGTMNFAGVRQVADILRPQFEALGFKVRWVDGAPFGRAGHLVAERAGRNVGKGRHILLIGHIDTVFEPNHPFQRFERTSDHIARGPGTADMKGGIVVALAALGALKQANVLDRLQITVVLHGDEEESGKPLALARATLIDAAKQADIAIGLENAADNPATAVTARRGYTGWRIDVQAKSAHSSQIFTNEIGAGAIYEVSRILDAFYEQLRNEPNLTFNPGLVAASTQVQFHAEPLSAEASGKDNIVAPVAVATGDIRALSMDQVQRTKDRMQRIVAENLPGTSATIAFTDSYPPMAPTEGNRRLLALYDTVSRDLGLGPVAAVNPRDAGAADISFAADHVDMAIDGLGLLGGGSHTPDEFADLRTFRTQAQRLAVLLLRLGKGAK
jgi:glutamate carboxypeptidase